jgi:hypothetical protein
MRVIPAPSAGLPSAFKQRRIGPGNGAIETGILQPGDFLPEKADDEPISVALFEQLLERPPQLPALPLQLLARRE